MAILNPRTASASADVVSVMDAETGRQMFSGARPLKASVSPTSKYMSHPGENGIAYVDHKIDLPVSIQLPVVMVANQYRDTYNELNEAKTSGTQLTVQTRTATYENMAIEAIPFEEDPEHFDTITMIIQLVEIIPAFTVVQTLPPQSVRNPVDASTVDRGQQEGSSPTDQQGSVASRIFRGI